MLLDSGSTIHFGETDPKNTSHCMITCGNCKRKRSISRITALGNYKDPDWSGFCTNKRKCQAARRSLGIEQAGQHKSQNNSGQENGDNRRSQRGRPPRPKPLDVLENIIVELWRELQLLKSITRDAVAAKFQLDDKDIGPDAITKWLKRGGINLRWTDFVMSVLRKRGELHS